VALYLARYAEVLVVVFLAGVLCAYWPSMPSARWLTFLTALLKEPILNIAVWGDGLPEFIAVDRSAVKLLGRWATPYCYWGEFIANNFVWLENPPCVDIPESLLEWL
jgi:hypothetical protein